jgi:hypothetical protein
MRIVEVSTVRGYFVLLKCGWKFFEKAPNSMKGGEKIKTIKTAISTSCQKSVSYAAISLQTR